MSAPGITLTPKGNCVLRLLAIHKQLAEIRTTLLNIQLADDDIQQSGRDGISKLARAGRLIEAAWKELVKA